MKRFLAILLLIPGSIYLLFCKIFKKSKKKESWYNNAHEDSSATTGATAIGAAGSANTMDQMICNTMTAPRQL